VRQRYEHSLLLFNDIFSFPYLVAINSVLPAIIAGNAVLLKPSPQTPLTAERLALALVRAGVPSDVIQVIHMSPPLTSFAVQHPLVDFVSFTGSVSGGHSIARSAVNGPRFTGIGLEVFFPVSTFECHSPCTC
jgi:acyl-CoA reductase-like NAD-dependent aldehyde dehydrogenase